MVHRTQHTIRIVILAGLLVLVFPALFSQTSSCDLQIPITEGFIDGHGNASAIGPGDTVCLLPGFRSYLWIRYLHGTSDAPIVIMNTLGGVSIHQFYYGIKIDSCSHIKLSGKGVSALPYGIHIFDISVGGGLSIEGLSTDVEIEGIEIYNTAFSAVYCKSDPDCSFTSTRDKYVMRNISFHDNYIHDAGNEGFYIGSSFYSGVIDTCNGKDTILLPHMIRGLKIFNNLVTRTGWDGIQASCADSACAIYHNEIWYDSDAAVFNQMSGIIMGEGSICDCYNNWILYGKGNGIQDHGLAGNKTYNNLIVNPGRTFPEEFPYQNGIYVGTQQTLPGNSFLIANNTIISPKDFALDFRNESSSGNRFINNLVMNWGRGLVNVEMGSNILVQNNYTDPNFDVSQFVDPGNGNFDLRPTSGAVNAAVPVSPLNLSFDILDRTRPFALVNDIGAYECHDSSLIAIPENQSGPSLRLHLLTGYLPDYMVIRYTIPSQDRVQIGLYDISGRLVMMVMDSLIPPGEYEQQFVPDSLAAGTYLVRMTVGHVSISKKFQLIR
ncbi:MAG: hypothetical protein D4R67_12465 [Bacteroidetes bacterium]|nr:MAG: hypothetical protein D4R67_12465 [Bacteroidota bacterium]